MHACMACMLWSSSCPSQLALLAGAATRQLTLRPWAGAGAGAGARRRRAGLGARRRWAGLGARRRRALLCGRRRRPVDAAHGEVTQTRHRQLARQLPEVEAAARAQPDQAGHQMVGDALVVGKRDVHLCGQHGAPLSKQAKGSLVQEHAVNTATTQLTRGDAVGGHMGKTEVSAGAASRHVGPPPPPPRFHLPSKMVDRSDSTLSMGGFLGSMCSQGSFRTSRSFHLVRGLPGVCDPCPGGGGGRAD
jgi:hypothetical protein